MKSAPVLLRELTAEWEAMRLHNKADKTIWSPNDVLAHVRACAGVLGKRITVMPAKQNPPSRMCIRGRGSGRLITGTGFSFVDGDIFETVGAVGEDSKGSHYKGLVWMGGDFRQEACLFSQVRQMAKHEIEHLEQIRNLPE